MGTLSDYDCLKNHIMNLGTISTEIEGRIVVSKCILCIFLRIHSTYIFFQTLMILMLPRKKRHLPLQTILLALKIQLDS